MTKNIAQGNTAADISVPAHIFVRRPNGKLIDLHIRKASSRPRGRAESFPCARRSGAEPHTCDNTP